MIEQRQVACSQRSRLADGVTNKLWGRPLHGSYAKGWALMPIPAFLIHTPKIICCPFTRFFFPGRLPWTFLFIVSLIKNMKQQYLQKVFLEEKYNHSLAHHPLTPSSVLYITFQILGGHFYQLSRRQKIPGWGFPKWLLPVLCSMHQPQYASNGALEKRRGPWMVKEWRWAQENTERHLLRVCGVGVIRRKSVFSF